MGAFKIHFSGTSLRCEVLAPSPYHLYCLGFCAPHALRCIPQNEFSKEPNK